MELLGSSRSWQLAGVADEQPFYCRDQTCVHGFNFMLAFFFVISIEQSLKESTKEMLFFVDFSSLCLLYCLLK